MFIVRQNLHGCATEATSYSTVGLSRRRLAIESRYTRRALIRIANWLRSPHAVVNYCGRLPDAVLKRLRGKSQALRTILPMALS